MHLSKLLPDLSLQPTLVLDGCFELLSTLLSTGINEWPSARKPPGKPHFGSQRLGPSGFSCLTHGSKTSVPCCYTTLHVAFIISVVKERTSIDTKNYLPGTSKTYSVVSPRTY